MTILNATAGFVSKHVDALAPNAVATWTVEVDKASLATIMVSASGAAKVEVWADGTDNRVTLFLGPADVGERQVGVTVGDGTYRVTCRNREPFAEQDVYCMVAGAAGKASVG